MSLDLNKVVIAGRLTATPDLSRTPNGTAVTSFSIAINKRTKDGEKKVDFINCVAWRATAEFITKYFSRGSAICVCGRLQTRSWDDPDSGKKRYATEVVADEAYFVESLSSSASAPAPVAETTSAEPAVTETAPPISDTLIDDDYPF